MKKIIALALSLTLVAGAFAGCSSKKDKEIIVGASPTPHAEILAFAKDILAEQGYTLTVKEFDDYVLPNEAVESKELDANYFQHLPYMENFNQEKGTHLVSVGAVHTEPFALYGGKVKSLDELQDGATISVPNDGTNEARALYLLEAAGLIKLKEGVGLTATKLDIVENPRNFNIEEIKAEQLSRSLEDVDIAAINGNYALQAGLNANEDGLFVEDTTSGGALDYANILAVREGNENREDIQALIKVLKSDKVKQFIEDNYHGGVVVVD